MANREQDILVLDGEAEISNFRKDGNVLKAKLNVLKDETVLELPFVYYQGYTVTIDGSKVKAVENKNGFLTIGLNKVDNIDLKVEYTGTFGMKFSKILSCISTIVFLGYVFSLNFTKKEEKSLEN